MKTPPDSESWGTAAIFLWQWALHFYREGHGDAGDRHLAVVLNNVREAVRAARREGKYA